jgi:hypothetical protein
VQNIIFKKFGDSASAAMVIGSILEIASVIFESS